MLNFGTRNAWHKDRSIRDGDKIHNDAMSCYFLYFEMQWCRTSIF